jgi:hypothetical protein
MIIPTFFANLSFINRVETFGENYNLKFYLSLQLCYLHVWFILELKTCALIEINSQEIRITNILFSKQKSK